MVTYDEIQTLMRNGYTEKASQLLEKMQDEKQVAFNKRYSFPPKYMTSEQAKKLYDKLEPFIQVRKSILIIWKPHDDSIPEGYKVSFERFLRYYHIQLVD